MSSIITVSCTPPIEPQITITFSILKSDNERPSVILVAFCHHDRIDFSIMTDHFG